jgi:FkbM family methyltransferase
MIQRLDNHTDPEHVWTILQKVKGMLAYDVGANIGQSTKVLADGFMHVIAWEPCIESYEILCEEMPHNVEPKWCAISDHDGYVALNEMDYSISTGQLTTGTGLAWGSVVGSRSVPCHTLDYFLEHCGVPEFVKIDTEGHEIKVLEGGKRMFSEVLPEVLVEVHDRKNEQPVRDLLLGYHLEKLEHHYLRAESEVRQDHFWIHATV